MRRKLRRLREKWLRWSVVFTALSVFGLVDIPDLAAKWLDVFAWLNNGEVLRWLLLVVGAVGLGTIAVLQVLERREKGQLATRTEGDVREQHGDDPAPQLVEDLRKRERESERNEVRPKAQEAQSQPHAEPAGLSPPSARRSKPSVQEHSPVRPSTGLPAELATLYHEGRLLDHELQVQSLSRLGEMLSGRATQRQVAREKKVREFDARVRMTLNRYERGQAFIQTWESIEGSPTGHSTLALIEPTVSHEELVSYLSSKVAYLRGIIKALGDSDPDPEDEKGNA